MPGIGTRFGDDVYNRTGIASVFGTELVGDEDVLLHEFRIGNEQARASDAIVVVILTVNLLVIVAAAESID